MILPKLQPNFFHITIIVLMCYYKIRVKRGDQPMILLETLCPFCHDDFMNCIKQNKSFHKM